MSHGEGLGGCDLLIGSGMMDLRGVQRGGGGVCEVGGKITGDKR